MEDKNNTKKDAHQLLPPYMPFKTFLSFIEKLKETTIPQRIDTSILKAYSGTIQRMLITTLKSLNLIDKDQIVDTKMIELVKAYQTDMWKDKLAEVINNRYAGIIGTLNITNATRYQLEEKFRNSGAEREVLGKCMAFYIAAVREAGINISPHITIERRGRPSEQKQRRTPKPKNGEPPNEEDDVPLSKPGMAQFRYHIKGKPPATISIPEDITAEEWGMIKKGIDAYVSPGEKKE